MIKNVIFDYGNTVIQFIPKNIVKHFGVENEDDVDLLTEKLFDRKYWDKFDDGSLSQYDFKNAVIKEIPDKLKVKAIEICDNWVWALPYIDGMDELIKKLKKDGYKIYLLSNISQYFADNSKSIEIFKYFDGLVFSAEILMVKPNKEIFEHLLEKYCLKREECVFIDDNESNVKAAESLGIRSLLFDGDKKRAEAFIYQG